MMRKYDVVLADPPWLFNSRGPMRGRFGSLPYKPMKFKDLLALPVEKIVADNAALFLWYPGSFIKEPPALCEAWGFCPVRIDSVWRKVEKSGKPAAACGPWGMSDCEFILLGVRGKMCDRQRRPHNHLTSCTSTVPKRHSRKPEIFREMIRDRFVGDIKRIELFATETCPCWDSLGFEINGRDIRDELKEIADFI